MLRRVATLVNSASNATPSGYGFSTPSLHSFAPCLRQMASLLGLVIPIRLRLLDRRTQGQAEAEVVRTARRAGREAVRRPATRRVEEPTAATEHAARAPVRTLWIGRRIWWIISIPILTPLSNITVHVIHAPSVWLFQSHWMCLTF